MGLTDRACPCLHTTPCQENCSCVKPHMSHGCARCCSYGSDAQARQMAEWLVVHTLTPSEKETLAECLRALAKFEHEDVLGALLKHNAGDLQNGGVTRLADKLVAQPKYPYWPFPAWGTDPYCHWCDTRHVGERKGPDGRYCPGPLLERPEEWDHVCPLCDEPKQHTHDLRPIFTGPCECGCPQDSHRLDLEGPAFCEGCSCEDYRPK